MLIEDAALVSEVFPSDSIIKNKNKAAKHRGAAASATGSASRAGRLVQSMATPIWLCLYLAAPNCPVSLKAKLKAHIAESSSLGSVINAGSVYTPDDDFAEDQFDTSYEYTLPGKSRRRRVMSDRPMLTGRSQHMYVYFYIHIYIHIYVHIYTYIYIYIYIRTQE